MRVGRPALVPLELVDDRTHATGGSERFGPAAHRSGADLAGEGHDAVGHAHVDRVRREIPKGILDLFTEVIVGRRRVEELDAVVDRDDAGDRRDDVSGPVALVAMLDATWATVTGPSNSRAEPSGRRTEIIVISGD